MNKKGNAVAAGIVVIGCIIGLLFLLNHLVFFADNFVRECSANEQCTENQYCGADFMCHEFPVTHHTTIEQHYSYNLLGPAIVLALAIVVSVLIIKRRQEKKAKNTAYYQEQSQER